MKIPDAELLVKEIVELDKAISSVDITCQTIAMMESNLSVVGRAIRQQRLDLCQLRDRLMEHQK
jgi:hypothetical protein